MATRTNRPRIHPKLRLLLAAAIAGLALLGPTEARGGDGGIRVHGATPGQEALVDWALDRFETAGLPLPALDIVFHGDAAECDGHLGMYFHSDARLELCTYGDFGKNERKTILHELAHAWANGTLMEADREAFVELRDVPTWGSKDEPWEERGTEQAAEVIAWALMDEPLSVYKLADNEPERLAEAYRFLTGSEPPFGIRGVGTDDPGSSPEERRVA